MSVQFPTDGDEGDTVVVDNKAWRFKLPNQWELIPLVDEFAAQLPIVKEEDSVAGLGRSFEHSFTIKDLQDLEYERFNNPTTGLPEV